MRTPTGGLTPSWFKNKIKIILTLVMANTAMLPTALMGCMAGSSSRAEDIGLAPDPFSAITSPAGFDDEPVSEVAFLTKIGKSTLIEDGD